MNNKFGVPCSKFPKELLKDVNIYCTNEAEAMALAVGVILAGKEPEVYIQNSGLGHCVDIITSLYKPYRIQLPKLHLSLRKQPTHHKYMGKITIPLIKLLKYPIKKITFYNDKDN